MDPSHTPDDDWVPISWSSVVFRLMGGLIVVGGLLAALGWAARGPLTAWSAWLVADLGYPGLLLGTLALDATPFTSHDPLLLAAMFAGFPFVPLAATVCFGAFVASWINWVGGRWLGRHSPWIQRMMIRYKIRPFLRYYGPWAMVVAGMIPMPFAIVAWGAGAAEVPPSTLFAGALTRTVKVLIGASLYAWSWHLTS